MPLPLQHKVEFNSSDKNHLREYCYFVKNGRWRVSCPFKIKDPFNSVPHMIERELALKYAEHRLKGTVEPLVNNSTRSKDSRVLFFTS